MRHSQERNLFITWNKEVTYVYIYIYTADSTRQD
jgi:hypothetical protein